MKPTQEVTRIIANESELVRVLVGLSARHGGAWVYSVRPFSHETTFRQFPNPSSVPDWYHDLTRGKMAHKGKLRGFTKAAKIRERNRALGSN